MTDPSVQNRKTVRHALATALATHYGSTVQCVYDHQVGRIDKQSPVVVVNSSGSQRMMAAFTALLGTESELHFDIHLFVRYQDEKAPATYTEAESEDDIDDLEQSTMNFLLINGYREDEGESAAAPWIELVPNGATEITQAIFEGIDYRHERIPIAARVGNIA